MEKGVTRSLLDVVYGQRAPLLSMVATFLLVVAKCLLVEAIILSVVVTLLFVVANAEANRALLKTAQEAFNKGIGLRQTKPRDAGAEVGNELGVYTPGPFTANLKERMMQAAV